MMTPDRKHLVDRGCGRCVATDDVLRLECRPWRQQTPERLRAAHGFQLADKPIVIGHSIMQFCKFQHHAINYRSVALYVDIHEQQRCIHN